MALCDGDAVAAALDKALKRVGVLVIREEADQ